MMTLYDYYYNVLIVAYKTLRETVMNSDHVPFKNDVRKAVLNACNDYIEKNKPDIYDEKTDLRVAVSVPCRKEKSYSITVILGVYKICARVTCYKPGYEGPTIVIDRQRSSLQLDPIIK